MKPPFAFASALGLPSEAFQFLRRSQNEVYAFEDSQGNARILRLTAASHRTLPELEDELNWVSHLHTSNLNACPPVPFPDGSWILSAPNGPEVLHGIVFARAQGSGEIFRFREWTYIQEPDGFRLYYVLGWDPRLFYDSRDDTWTFEPGNGSPVKTIILDPWGSSEQGGGGNGEHHGAGERPGQFELRP